MKARYYSVSKTMLQLRGVKGGDNHPYFRFPFDEHYERRRKQATEKISFRSPEELKEVSQRYLDL